MSHKVISSRGGFIVSLILIGVAGLLAWAALNVFRNINVLTKGPFIKSTQDLTKHSAGNLENKIAVYTGFIVTTNNETYLSAPNVDQDKVVFYIYEEYHRTEDEEGEISYILRQEEYKSLDFQISVGGHLFRPEFKSNDQSEYQTVMTELSDRRIFTKYLQAGELVTVLAQKQGDVLKQPRGLYSYFLKDSEGEFKKKGILSLIILGVFTLLILYFGIRGLISSISG